MATNNSAPVAFVVVDGRKVNVDVHGTELAAIINEMVQAESKAYGAHVRIAAKLNDLMPFDWFDIDPKEVSDNAKAFKPHWKAVYDGFKAAGHTNPSVPGKRIRDYGRNLRAGLAPNGKTMADGSALPNSVSEDGEGEGEGANPTKRSPMLRNVEERIALWKFNEKQDNLPEKLKAIRALDEQILSILGIDVRTIK